MLAGTPARRTGLIALLTVATLAAAAALLEPGEGSRVATPAAAEAAVGAMVPVGIVGESTPSRDPSVPSAASVFRDRNVQADEPPVSF
jgi:hypothetical protein